MRNTATILGLVTLLAISAACTPPQFPSVREQLSDIGLFGEHQILRIESFGTVRGSVSGSFFLGIGSVSGNIGSEYKLQFWWTPVSGEIIATSLPYSAFLFVIDDTKKTPTVEFIFSPRWLNRQAGTQYTIARREETKMNLNNFILSSKLMVVKVKISQATLEQEVYLPKTR